MRLYVNITRMLGIAVLGIVVAAVSTSCASSRFDSFERDPAYLYGSGVGPNLDQALAAARENLRSSCLAYSLGESAENFSVTEDMKKSAALPASKPFIKEKKDGNFCVVVRIPVAEWEAIESSRRSAVRSELVSRLAAVSADRTMPLSDRLSAAARIVERVSREGLYSLLTETENGGKLLVDRVKEYCRGVVSGLSFNVEPRSGLIDAGAPLTISLVSKDGLSVAGARAAAQWKSESGGSERSTLIFDAKGTARLSFSGGSKISDHRVRLELSTAFAELDTTSDLLASLDGMTKAIFSYHYFEDIEASFYDMVRVPGGSFSAGAVPQDRKADRKKEAPRKAEVSDFLMDRCPVTNAQYRAFLEDTGTPFSAYPEYIDHPDYGAPDQPVIGVSLEDAERFAEWISTRFGKPKRLPTEDEWERAARGGADSIFPWGDQPPTSGAFANYNGNGRFDGPSPVGGFEAGKNALGLYDMAGNVWQWTSTSAASDGSPEAQYIVKGGSWMDGPNELRVSNRRSLDAAKGYPDVGFRLVMEVQHE